MSVSVVRYKRKSNYSIPMSPELYYLKQDPGSAKTCSIEDIAKEIEEISSLSMGDVVHTMNIFMSQLRKVLVRGDKVRVADLGTFYMTFGCVGAAEEKDCTVRGINRVSVRFRVSRDLRLVNNAIATSRSDNNVTFALKEEKPCVHSGGEADGGGGGTVDPEA